MVTVVTKQTWKTIWVTMRSSLPVWLSGEIQTQSCQKPLKSWQPSMDARFTLLERHTSVRAAKKTLQRFAVLTTDSEQIQQSLISAVLNTSHLYQRFSTFWDLRTTYKFCLLVADHHWKLYHGKLPKLVCLCGFGDYSSPDDLSPDCSSHRLFAPLSYKGLSIKNLANNYLAIQLLFKQRSFNLSSFYLAKNYLINPASN